MKVFRELSSGDKDHDFFVRNSYLKSIGAEYLGHGQSREVYGIGNNYVLKLQKPNTKFFNQNRAEYKRYQCAAGKHSRVLAPIAAIAPDFSWLVMRKADKVFNSFQEKELTEYMNTFLELPEEFVLYGYMDFVHTVNGYANGFIGHQDDTIIVDRVKWLKTHPTKWLLDLIDLIDGCTVNTYDLHPGNWGIIDGVLVMIDYGFAGYH